MSSNPSLTAEGLDFGTVPAELVWFVSEETEAYDCLLYRSMTAEVWLCAALAGRNPCGLWRQDRFEDRREVWERAAQALLSSGAS